MVVTVRTFKVFTNDVVGEVSTDDNCRARALTPNSLSSWGYPVMSKRRKTEYDVQKNLCGLMFDSQPSAKSRRAFVPPGQRRKINGTIRSYFFASELCRSEELNGSNRDLVVCNIRTKTYAKLKTCGNETGNEIGQFLDVNKRRKRK